MLSIIYKHPLNCVYNIYDISKEYKKYSGFGFDLNKNISHDMALAPDGQDPF